MPFARPSGVEEYRSADHFAIFHEVTTGNVERIVLLHVRVTDTDAKSNRSKDPANVLAAHEREKKNYKACLEQRHHFSSFVVSDDVVIVSLHFVVFKMVSLTRKREQILLKKLSALLLAKK
jgi:hypothetical protein